MSGMQLCPPPSSAPMVNQQTKKAAPGTPALRNDRNFLWINSSFLFHLRAENASPQTRFVAGPEMAVSLHKAMISTQETVACGNWIETGKHVTTTVTEMLVFVEDEAGCRVPDGQNQSKGFAMETENLPYPKQWSSSRARATSKKLRRQIAL